MINLSSSALIDPRLVELVGRQGADGCRLYLEELRWPAGVECPRCGASDIYWLEQRGRHSCRRCRYQFRVTARTVFHDSHLALPKWFLAISLMLVDGGISALRLHEILGGSYKSAWFLEHRVRAAIGSPARPLAGPVGYVNGGAGRPVRVVAVQEAPTWVPAPSSWGVLRSLIAGGHRRVGIKYLNAYWDEVRWRESHREDPEAFRKTVLALLAHPWLPYRELTTQSATAKER